MSVDSRAPEPEQEPGRTNRALVAGIAAAVVGLIAVVLVVTRGDGPPDAAAPASPDATAPADPTEAPTVASTPATEPPEETPPAASEPPVDQNAAQPSDQDIDGFVESYGPAQHTATGDVDGDGLTDVVIAASRDDTTQINVGFWDGEAFRHESDEGGPAQLVDALTVQDFNGVPGAEIVTEQSVGEAGHSLSVWGGESGRLARHTGEGGCWDGFHTYGISGATIEAGKITATCDGSPLPPEAWSSDVYEWDDGAWVHTESITPEE